MYVCVCVCAVCGVCVYVCVVCVCGAIIVNAVFLLLYLIVFSFKKEIKIPRWIIIFNLILLGFQIYFHFIFK